MRNIFSIVCFLLVLTISESQFTKEQYPQLQQINCDEPSIHLHVFSGTPNPVWNINKNQLKSIKDLAYNTLFLAENNTFLNKPTTRVMGYHGFTISCPTGKSIFIHGLFQLEQYLLFTGRRHLSTSIMNHVNNHLGEVMSDVNPVEQNNADCNTVPIRGPDTVPQYNPSTDDGGCFVKKQSENNCYAYGTDIVTNTFPQPGRGSGKKWVVNTCADMGNSSVRDGLVYSGTALPTTPPPTGHYVALLIWPNTNFHWIRMDQNGYWSHKPGGTPVRNKDNRNLPITDPSKSDFSPWTQFCYYFVAQPSKLQIN